MTNPRRIAILGSGRVSAALAVALLANARMTDVARAETEKPRIEDDSRWNPKARQSKEKAQWKRERAGRKS
jgi:hypothetical protein